MRKIALRIDDLQVDSFDATPNDGRARGTVYGKSESTAPCWAATAEGSNCDSTQYQDMCTCTNGGPYNTTCDVNLTCGVYGSCPYETCEGPQDNTTCTGG
jgi:hypothetical protein